VRVGVFGGSFDPVHFGHLALAPQAAQRLQLGQVRFVPARVQPLKAAGAHATAEDRVAMLRLAVAGEPEVAVDTREVERPGPSFTVDTLREMRTEQPSDELFLLIGTDAAREFARWRAADEVARLATIVVIPRRGALPLAPRPGWIMLDIQPPDISATAVRSAIGQGAAIDRMVPAPVGEYIRAHGLYRTGV
jgi:nicotinate-nucleotide adenylyltransferase